MKKVISAICSILIFVSCSKDEATITSPPVVIVPGSTAVLKFTGTFSPRPGESGTGMANIYLDGTTNTLKLENFMITNGPDLKVYLSKTEGTTSIVNLGSLKTSGEQSYVIPTGVTIADYKYVLIYCQQYSVLFTSAMLMEK